MATSLDMLSISFKCYTLEYMTTLNHEFSPIVNGQRLEKAIDYVAAQSLLLARAVLGRELTIDTICFFAQGNEEYDYLLGAVLQRGPLSKFSHEPTTYVDTDFVVADQHIKILGVRQPDTTRLWVGYGDYPVTSTEYEELRNGANPHIREINSGLGQALLQFEHPDFDVLGFAFMQDEHDVSINEDQL